MGERRSGTRSRCLGGVAAALVAALATLAVLAPGASASWPMFQHDREHSGRSDLLGAQQPDVAWSFTTALTPGSPVVAPDGTIYLPSGERDDEAGTLHAVAPDGSQRWAYTLPGAPVSTPAVGADGTIFVHTYSLGNLASIEHLVAINPDGSRRFDITPFNGGVANLASFDQSSPVVGADGRVWVGSRDGGLYSFNPSDGSISCAVAASDSNGIISAPAIAPDGTVYALAFDSTLSAYGPDCSPKWELRLSPVITNNPQSPAIAADGAIWVADRDSSVVAVEPSGSERCRFATGDDVDSTAAFGADGTVYVASDGLYAVNPSDCSRRWRFGQPLFSQSSPVVDSAGTIYWRESFTVHAVDPSGAEIWSTPVGDSATILDPSPAIGEGERLYLSDGGGLGFEPRLRALTDLGPAPPPPEVPAAELVGSKKLDAGKKKVPVKLRCPGGVDCSGTAKLKASGSGSGRVAMKSKTLAKAAYSIPAGEIEKVKMKLTDAGRKTVKNHKKSKAKLVIASDDGPVNKVGVKLLR